MAHHGDMGNGDYQAAYRQSLDDPEAFVGRAVAAGADGAGDAPPGELADRPTRRRPWRRE